MMLRRTAFVGLLVVSLLAPSAALAQQPAPTPTPDPNDPIVRIKDEGMNRSQVMDTLSYLSDVIGPRLTASPNMKRANEWTRDQLTKWGLQNAHLESWGPFGRGWSLKRFSAQVVEPQAIPLIAYPKAWSPALDAPLTAEVVYVDAQNEADLQKFAGQLNGKIVLTSPMREVKARFEAPGSRMDEKELLALADAQEPRPVQRGGGAGGGQQGLETFRNAQRLAAAKYMFFQKEGAALLIDPSRIGDGGTLFVQSATVPQPPSSGPPVPGAPRGPQAYDKSAPKITPQLVMAIEHYNRIVRMIKANEKVKMTVDLAVDWQDWIDGLQHDCGDPGSDLKDEVVMLGGHMDSWHSGTGATDNGAASVAMEAVRIIQALNLKPRRTIRIGLWTGEEQGCSARRTTCRSILGSLSRATRRCAPGTPTPARRSPKLITQPDYEKFAGYFNLDNGTGKIRGVYLQGNEAVRPIFRQWLAPLRISVRQRFRFQHWRHGSSFIRPHRPAGIPPFRMRLNTTLARITRIRTSSIGSRVTI